jgi:hypothetical protein
VSYSWGASRSTAGGAAVAPRAPHTTRVHRPRLAPAPPAEKGAEGPDQLLVAAELAPMVDVWQRLLAQHVPDSTGRCRTCTKGGTGLPTTPWPCVIHTIADRARTLHDAKQKR